MVCTRPDISNAVGEVSRFCDNFGIVYWQAAIKILKYLKTKISMALTFDGRRMNLMINNIFKVFIIINNIFFCLRLFIPLDISCNDDFAIITFLMSAAVMNASAQ